MLVPAVDCAIEWWLRAGQEWKLRDQFPQSSVFKASVRKTVADAEGNFAFSDLPSGFYYVRSFVTWETFGPYGISERQGGIVGAIIEISEGKSSRVILTWK